MDDNPLPPGVTHEEAVEQANLATVGTMMERVGIEWLEIGPNRVVARMPVEGNTQPYGMLHGGATATLCESVASYGTAVAAGLDKITTGIHLSVNHVRPVTGGGVTATGTPVHVGRTTAVWDIRVEDDEGRLVAVSRLTLAIREPGSTPPNADPPG